MLTMWDLFAGIGGFSLAARMTGEIETTLFCEIDPFARKVLEKHWPGVPKVNDIRWLADNAFRYSGHPDIITGGFPCQPFSIAGKQAGTDDPRYLWPAMFGVIQATRPAWVLAENNPPIIEMALDAVLANLEGEGYETGTFVLPACSVGAPHLRNRVWIVGHSQSGEDDWRIAGELAGACGCGRRFDNATDPPSEGVAQGDTYGRRQHRQSRRRSGSEPANGHRGIEEGEALGLASDGGIRRRETSRGSGQHALSGEADGLGGSTVSGLGRMLDGLSGWLDAHRWPASRGAAQEAWEPARVGQRIMNRNHRLKALGNAIVPQVAYPILQAIVDIEQGDKP